MQLNLQVITLSWGGGNQLLDAFNLCLGGSSNACNRFAAIYYLILHVVLLFVRISFPIQTLKAIWSYPHLTYPEVNVLKPEDAVYTTGTGFESLIKYLASRNNDNQFSFSFFFSPPYFCDLTSSWNMSCGNLHRALPGLLSSIIFF